MSIVVLRANLTNIIETLIFIGAILTYNHTGCIKTCQKCSTIQSDRWYFTNICRSCRRKELRDTPQVLKTREIVALFKANPKCWDCSSEKTTRWYKNHTQCQACCNKEYNIKNKTSVSIYRKIYRLKNKKELNLKKRIHRQKTGNHRIDQKLRKARKRTATVKWANKKELRRIYTQCPEGMTVDHIIPIKNDLVCGLHVPENLQYLTISENSKKWNKFDGTFENNSWRKNA